MDKVCLDRSMPASKNARAGDIPSTKIVLTLQERQTWSSDWIRACLPRRIQRLATSLQQKPCSHSKKKTCLLAWIGSCPPPGTQGLATSQAQKSYPSLERDAYHLFGAVIKVLERNSDNQEYRSIAVYANQEVKHILVQERDALSFALQRLMCDREPWMPKEHTCIHSEQEIG